MARGTPGPGDRKCTRCNPLYASSRMLVTRKSKSVRFNRAHAVRTGCDSPLARTQTRPCAGCRTRHRQARPGGCACVKRTAGFATRQIGHRVGWANHRATSVTFAQKLWHSVCEGTGIQVTGLAYTAVTQRSSAYGRTIGSLDGECGVEGHDICSRPTHLRRRLSRPLPRGRLVSSAGIASERYSSAVLERRRTPSSWP